VGQFFSRDYFFAQGEFIATQLKELDVEADDDDQLFSGLPVLEALEECAKRTHEVSFIGSQKPGVLSIREGNNGHSSGVNQVGAGEQDAMDADEKLARHLQEYEDRTVARQGSNLMCSVIVWSKEKMLLCSHDNILWANM
jgi:hypothetical protein